MSHLIDEREIHPMYDMKACYQSYCKPFIHACLNVTFLDLIIFNQEVLAKILGGFWCVFVIFQIMSV